MLLVTSWGTHLEHFGNLGTWWEYIGNKEKKKKNSLSPPPTQKERKKLDQSWVHAEASHWLHEISVFKTVCLSIFGLGIRQGQKFGDRVGTWWELIGNVKGTCWEQRKNEKNPAPPPPPASPNLKEKQSRHFECMLSLPIHCMKLRCSKTVHHHFWPGLIPPT